MTEGGEGPRDPRRLPTAPRGPAAGYRVPSSPLAVMPGEPYEWIRRLRGVDALGLAGLVRRATPADSRRGDRAARRGTRGSTRCHEALRPRAPGHRRGLPDGPFRGVPFLMKDLTASIAGVPHDARLALLRGHAAPHRGQRARARASSAPGSSSSGAPTRASSGCRSRASPCCTGPRATRGIPRASPAARAAARRPPSARACCRWRTPPTASAPSAPPPRAAASWGSSPRARATPWRRSSARGSAGLPASTPSRSPCATPPRSWTPRSARGRAIRTSRRRPPGPYLDEVERGSGHAPHRVDVGRAQPRARGGGEPRRPRRDGARLPRARPPRGGGEPGDRGRGGGSDVSDPGLGQHRGEPGEPSLGPAARAGRGGARDARHRASSASG